jgi:hypothetical protein
MRFEGRLLHDQRYLWGLIGRPFQFLQSSLSVNANSHQSNPDDASDLGCRSPPRGRWWAPPLAARCVSEKRGSDVDIGVAGGLGEGCLEEGVSGGVSTGRAQLPWTKKGSGQKDGGRKKTTRDGTDAGQKWAPKREPGLLLMSGV